jgi:MFS family permease
LKFELPAFQSRNFRFFLVGQALSLFGNSMQQVALAWLVYRSTHSPVILGLVGFAGGLPAALVAPFAGVLADRSNPQRIVVAAQILAVLPALLLALLVYIERTDVAAIIVLVCVIGIVSGIDMPVQQMFVARLVNRKDDVGSAVALNSVAYDGARVLGPAVGGIIVASYSEGFAFLANGLCHVLVVAIFLVIRLQPGHVGARDESVVQTLVHGMRYAMTFQPVLAILLLSGCVSFAGSAYMVLMPVMAATVLDGGPYALGFLLGSISVGAIAGGLYLSTRRDVAGFAELICIGASLFGFGLLAFSQSTMLYLSAATLCVAGFGIMMMMASCNTILLTITDASKHGRILSLFTLSFLAMAPLGAVCSGVLASKISAQATIAASAVLCLLSALAFSSQVASVKRLIHTQIGGTDKDKGA